MEVRQILRPAAGEVFSRPKVSNACDQFSQSRPIILNHDNVGRIALDSDAPQGHAQGLLIKRQGGQKLVSLGRSLHHIQPIVSHLSKEFTLLPKIQFAFTSPL